MIGALELCDAGADEDEALSELATIGCARVGADKATLTRTQSASSYVCCPPPP